MSSIPSNIARAPGLLTADLLRNNLRSSNLQLLDLQGQIATGKRVNKPSDDASVVSGITLLNRVLDQFDQQLTNLHRAQASIDTTDQSLSDVNDILLEAQNIASSQVGVGSTPETRKNQALVIDGLITALVNTANRDVRGVYLFGGDNAHASPFGELLGGIQYTGGKDDLTADLGLLSAVGVNLNGATAFGAVSGRVNSDVDLNPAATAATKLSNVSGARGLGVMLGTIQVNVNGSTVDVTMAHADTLGDVATRINNAINSVDAAAGALAVTDNGLTLTANAGHTITISDIGTGIAAADLGIDITATSGATVGGDVNPKLTALTPVTALPGGIDLASGLKITVGQTTKVVDFAGATTVREMMNAVEASGLGVRLEINADASGFDLVSRVSGLAMSVGENAGGTTASDLGVRTFDHSTLLQDFRFGVGVETVDGNDLRIVTRDGTEVDVDLSGTTTVGDVVSAINATAGGAVTASLAADGNGLVLTDNTAGAGSFAVLNLNNSHAAEHLGISQDVGAAGVISGSDNAQVRVDSVFTHLMMLRDGLVNDDERLITEAGYALHRDTDTVAGARAQMGVRSRHVMQQMMRVEERSMQNQSLRSELQDADYNEVISRFVQLQQQMQGSMLAGQQMFSLSLLDFLR